MMIMVVVVVMVIMQQAQTAVQKGHQAVLIGDVQLP
jgi:hypothetical protein